MNDKDLLIALTLAALAGGIPSSNVIGVACKIMKDLKPELKKL